MTTYQGGPDQPYDQRYDQSYDPPRQPETGNEALARWGLETESTQVARPYDEEERGKVFDDTEPYRDEYAEPTTEERFGGINWGAGFFGWLVTVGMAVLLAGIVGAAATALDRTVDGIRTQAEAQPQVTAVVAAAVLVLVLMTAYYAGGYVAGRMSRFDGGRQGAGVWLTGLLLSATAVGLGLVFGAEYNVMERVNLPSLPVPTEAVGLGGLVTAAAALLGSLLAAIGGGKVGCRYHRKVDEYGYGAS